MNIGQQCHGIIYITWNFRSRQHIRLDLVDFMVSTCMLLVKQLVISPLVLSSDNAVLENIPIFSQSLPHFFQPLIPLGQSPVRKVCF